KAHERLGLARSRRVHPLRVSRWQRANIPIERERLRHATKQMEAYEPSRLWVSRDAIAREQRLDLRCKTECPTVIRSVKRLDTVSVAREKQAVAFCVPHRECEHAAQTVHHLGAVLRIEVQQHFCIGARAESRSLSLEIPSQLRMIIDFAIKYDDE